MENTIRPFVQKSDSINTTFIDIFNDKLGLPKGTLASRHTLYDPSGSETRCIKVSPRPGGVDDAKTALGAHTDFGSLVRYLVFWPATVVYLTLVVPAQPGRWIASLAPWR